MSLATDLRARLAVAEETDGPVLLLPVEARDVLAVIGAAHAYAALDPAMPWPKFAEIIARVARAVVFADEKETP